MPTKFDLKKLVFLLIFILYGFTLPAQLTQVSGTILDENNLPLAGVNIYKKSTTAQGTTSDINGAFRIEAELNSILVFSFVGYKTSEVPVTSAQMSISLEVEAIGLAEGVAIGYGSIRKRDVSSSISIVQG